jgi:hypothetical protein
MIKVIYLFYSVSNHLLYINRKSISMSNTTVKQNQSVLTRSAKLIFLIVDRENNIIFFRYKIIL